MKTVKLKICRGRKTQLVVLNLVVTNPCCGLAVNFCGFISLLISRETTNIPEILWCSGFYGKDCNCREDKYLNTAVINTFAITSVPLVC